MAYCTGLHADEKSSNAEKVDPSEGGQSHQRSDEQAKMLLMKARMLNGV